MAKTDRNCEKVPMFKGFNPDMTCTPAPGICLQYKEGETYYHDGEAELCSAGFHACENPLDCFAYYPPGTSVYHEVKLGEITDEKSDDSKRCGKIITIGAALDVAGICKAHFEYTKSRTTNNEQGKDNANLAAQDGSSLAAGRDSVLAAFNSKAKAKLGSIIVLANREWEHGCYVIKDFAAGVVDGEKIKPDTWYTVKNGQFVEVEDGTA